MTKKTSWTSLGIFALSVVSVFAITTAIALQPGCSGSACVGVGDPSQPSATIECPAGLLCYRGQCQQGCNAGMELTLMCTTSDDCDSSRPNCVGGFCSVCPESETCIPTINICRRVDPVPAPEEVERPGPTSIKPAYALDGSVFDPQGLQPGTDGGVMEVPVDIPITHAVFIDLAQEEDWRVAGHPRQGRFDVRAYHVMGSTVANVRWRGDRSPLAYEAEREVGTVFAEACAYRTLREVPSAQLVPFGEVRIDDNDPGDGLDPFIVPGAKYSAEFTGGGYTVTPMVPADFLRLSTPRPADMSGPSLVRTLNITGLGSPFTDDAAWGSDSPVPVPFPLVPLSPDVEFVNLTATQVLATPAQDLTFHWEVVPTGVTDSMRVRVRIPSGTHELFCEVVEARNNGGTIEITDRIQVVANLLELLRADVGAGTTLPIYFERTQRVLLYAPGPDADGGVPPYVHNVTVWVRHTLIGELRL